MTAFIKENFEWDGMYLNYATDGLDCLYKGIGERKFVARFKYGGAWKNWVNFMVKNFSQEEYFELAERTSPVDAMQSKEYLKPCQKKMLKRDGYPATWIGYCHMLANLVEANYKKYPQCSNQIREGKAV